MAAIIKTVNSVAIAPSAFRSSKKSKKTSKKNGFSLYMEERRPGMLAAGHSLAGGNQELAVLVSEDWKALSVDEKAKYNEKAKMLNERLKHQQHGDDQSWSKAGILKSLTVACSSDKLSNEDKRNMEEARSIVINLFDEEDWINYPIVICSISVYLDELETVDDVYLPAEVGLTAMTIKEGVVDNFGRVIDPGFFLSGNQESVAKTVEKLGIPTPGSVSDFADYEDLMLKVKNFLEKHQGSLEKRQNELLVFAFDSDYVIVRRCFDWLLAKIGNYRFSVKVLSLDQFAYVASSIKARNTKALDNPATGSDEPTPPEGSIIVTISPHRSPGVSLTGRFLYPEAHPMLAFGIFIQESDVESAIKQSDNNKFYELCCVYHDKSGKEVHQCALNNSNRYAYSLLEVLTISNDVPILAGGHYIQVDTLEVEKARIRNWLQKSGITVFEEEMQSNSNSDEEDEVKYVNACHEMYSRDEDADDLEYDHGASQDMAQSLNFNPGKREYRDLYPYVVGPVPEIFLHPDLQKRLRKS